MSFSAVACFSQSFGRKGLKGVRYCGAILFLATLRLAAENDGAVRMTFAELATSATVSAPIAATRETLNKVLSATVLAAEGKQVEVTGYFLPLVSARGKTTQFLLLRSQMACCYGTMPQPSEYLVGQVGDAGLSAEMDTPVTLQGTLRITPVVQGGEVVQVYQLEGASVARR